MACFADINFSQGSVYVATYARCGGIFDTVRPNGQTLLVAYFFAIRNSRPQLETAVVWLKYTRNNSSLSHNLLDYHGRRKLLHGPGVANDSDRHATYIIISGTNPKFSHKFSHKLFTNLVYGRTDRQTDRQIKTNRNRNIFSVTLWWMEILIQRLSNTTTSIRRHSTC